jgi:hypothetical protein
MNSLDLALNNLASPPILFFVLGGLAVALHSDLELPEATRRWLALYLLFAIGMKGGVALREEGIGGSLPVLLAAMVLSGLIPVIWFHVLKKRLGPANAAGIAACYGSVSAVTFVTAVAWLDRIGVPYGGSMVAAMALMEWPAIVVGILLAQSQGNGRRSMGPAIREALVNGSLFLILGSLIVGFIAGPERAAPLVPFYKGIFPGMLTFFLLDMGMMAARRLRDIRRAGGVLVAFGLGAPFVGATLGILAAYWIGLDQGNAFLLTVLAASASYIAVPAALRTAIPAASPGLFVPLALGITFPFNVVIGLPLYLNIIRALWL